MILKNHRITVSQLLCEIDEAGTLKIVADDLDLKERQLAGMLVEIAYLIRTGQITLEMSGT